MHICDSAINGATIIRNIGCDNFEHIAEEIQIRINDEIERLQNGDFCLKKTEENFSEISNETKDIIIENLKCQNKQLIDCMQQLYDLVNEAHEIMDDANKHLIYSTYPFPEKIHTWQKKKKLIFKE